MFSFVFEQSLEDVDFEYPNISEPWAAEDVCRRPQWPHSKDGGPHRRRQRPHHKRQPHYGAEGGLHDEAEASPSQTDGTLPAADTYNGDVMFDDDINSKPIKRIDADPVRKYDVNMPVFEDFMEPKNYGGNRPQDGFQVSESSSTGGYGRSGGGGTYRGSSGKTVNTRKGSPYEENREEFEAMERDLLDEVNHHHSSSSSLDGYWDRTAKNRLNAAPRTVKCSSLWLVTSLVVVVSLFSSVLTTRTW